MMHGNYKVIFYSNNWFEQFVVFENQRHGAEKKLENPS